MRRLLIIVLCAFLAVGAPLAAAFAPDTPCGSMESAAGDDASPCGCDSAAGATDCALACAVASSAVLIGYDSLLQPVPAANFQAATPRLTFTSYAGPPGLQPPRA